MTTTRDKRTVITPQLVIGAFIMLLGVLLTFDRLGLMEATPFRQIWPLLVIGIGVALLVQRVDPRGRFWGIVWTSVGSWMLLNAMGWVPVGILEMAGPVILLIVGGSLLSHAWRRERPQGPNEVILSGPGLGPPPSLAESPHSNRDGQVMQFAVMAESKRTSHDHPFRGGEMTAFMGGCQLDLRRATIEPGQTAVINILAVMAGHEIWVPSGWSVAIDVIPLLAGVEDKRLPPVELPPTPPPVLRIRGVAFMGNVVIKN